MTDSYDVAGYCHVTSDGGLDMGGISIEGQKDIIKDFVRRELPGSTLVFFADRNATGYLPEQCEGYWQMRGELLERRYGVMVVSDFSRLSVRGRQGLAELELLRDAGIRIISIGDDIDYPTRCDWLHIQLHFTGNGPQETVRAEDVQGEPCHAPGAWAHLNEVPYGYAISNKESNALEIDEAAAEVVKMVFSLYIEGWGYKKIADYLTALGVPTPRMRQLERVDDSGGELKLRKRAAWSIVTIQGILCDDFYIGTMRKRGSVRKAAEAAVTRLESGEWSAWENNHKAIVDYRSFAIALEQRERRGATSYRGTRKNDNAYSGLLYCGDCGAPMFAKSRRGLLPSYCCGAYHRHGLKACSSHHIRAEQMDERIKAFVARLRRDSEGAIGRLKTSIDAGSAEIASIEEEASALAGRLESASEELKATKRQKIREIMRRPERELPIERLYSELEAGLEERIGGLLRQLDIAADRRGTIIRANRRARTVIEVMDEIAGIDGFDRHGVGLLIDRAEIFESGIRITLKREVNELLDS